MEIIWAILVLLGIILIDYRLAKILREVKYIREDLEFMNSNGNKPDSDLQS